jgi:hypothetical protein
MADAMRAGGEPQSDARTVARAKAAVEVAVRQDAAVALAVAESEAHDTVIACRASGAPTPSATPPAPIPITKREAA